MPKPTKTRSQSRATPTHQVHHQIHSQQLQVSQKIHQGPLPAPEDLQRYEQLLPGAAERIIKMAELEQQHRHSQEVKAISSEVVTREILQSTEKSRISGVMSSDKRGQYLGGAVSVLAIAGSVYCASIQQPVVAIALVSMPILGIVKALLSKPSQLSADKNSAKKQG